MFTKKANTLTRTLIPGAKIEWFLKREKDFVDNDEISNIESESICC